MTLANILTVCQAYEKLGWAVQEQFWAVYKDAAVSEQNPAALRLCIKFLRLVQQKSEDATTQDECASLLEIMQGSKAHLPPGRPARTYRPCSLGDTYGDRIATA